MVVAGGVRGGAAGGPEHKIGRRVASRACGEAPAPRQGHLAKGTIRRRGAAARAGPLTPVSRVRSLSSPPPPPPPDAYPLAWAPPRRPTAPAPTTTMRASLNPGTPEPRRGPA